MKLLIGLLATILTLSVSYYFTVSLPAHNRAALDFEREKYRTAQEEKKSQEEEDRTLRDSAEQDSQLCTALAEAAYDNNLKSNGTPNGKGGYSLPTSSLNVIERQKTQALEECQMQYARKIKSAR